MLDETRTLRKVLEAIGRQDLNLVRSRIGSRQLSAALRLIVEENEGQARLFIPHYWAVFYHDGRKKGARPTRSRNLVFFDNPHDDPRLRGAKYPVHPGDVRRLTKREYQRGLEINAQRAKRGQTRPYMWVVPEVGPSPARPFFKNLSQNAAARADATAHRAFNREIRKWVRTDPATKPETRTATARL